MNDAQTFREQIGRIEQLVRDIESTADPATRAGAKELVQSVMDLHGAAIKRIMETVIKAGEASSSIVRSLCADELVGSLLVLYDQHPEDFATRVGRGIERVRPFLTRRAAEVQILAIEDATVQLRIHINGHSCGSTSAELESMVRGAVFEAAPDAADIVFEPAPREAASGFVPLEKLQRTGNARAIGCP